jgi:hypothetical protein
MSIVINNENERKTGLASCRSLAHCPGAIGMSLRFLPVFVSFDMQLIRPPNDSRISWFSGVKKNPSMLLKRITVLPHVTARSREFSFPMLVLVSLFILKAEWQA